MQHNVCNIRSGRPFSEVLVQHLLRVTNDDPESLSRYRLLLPTRRACRILRETFLNLNEGKPILLPQMSPIGDVEEEDLALMMFGSAQGFLDISAAIAPLKRQVLLANLIKRVPDFAQSTDQALALAAALGRFIDQVIVEGLDFSDLHKVVPEDFSEHWQLTLEFLKIISENWPKILEAEGVIDVARRRNLLLQALAGHWRNCPPEYPVIAAGSTGSIPAVAALLDVISTLPQGQVVLPGFDSALDDETLSHITPSHPQHALKITLDRMNLRACDVQDLVAEGSGGVVGRSALACTLMLPAELTHRWKDFPARYDLAAMLDNLEYYSCRTQQDEAILIALIMREVLEQDDGVCALITPDRTLARRVRSYVKKWGIEVDDSAGENLAESRLGKFINLSAGVCEGGFNPVTMLSLMKMSLCRFGMEERAYSKALSDLEIDYLRQDYLIKSQEMLRTKISDHAQGEHVLVFIDAFYAALSSLCDCFADARKVPFHKVLKAHIEIVEALSETDIDRGAEILWRGDVGETASDFLSDLASHAHYIGDVSLGEYSAVLEMLMRGVSVRVSYGVHPRLLILGQLEARLSSADIVIMGGLNEGTWPPEDKHDPWMSRPMRGDFGLPGTDQMIGFAAHDFVQGFCAPRTILTRSEKVDGSPSVPARWLSRLDTVLQAGGKSLGTLSTGSYLHWVGEMDKSDVVVPCARPEPCPPVSVRPRGASVTKIETWLQNPYAIYMHYVLNLRKMNPLMAENDARLKGNVLHKVLETFTNEYPVDLPENAEGILIDIARGVIADTLEDADDLSYWWPSLYRIAAWFCAHEQEWRATAKFLESEIKGNIDLDIEGGAFNLYGMADRIDRVEGGYALIDYKTGGSFSAGKLGKGDFPQLPLEAVILAQGGFYGRGFKSDTMDEPKKHVPKGEAKYMGYWKMTGRGVSGESVGIAGDLDETIEVVLDGLTGLIKEFRKEKTPFFCVPDAKNAPRFNDYEHVSRLKEWTALDESETGGEVA